MAGVGHNLGQKEWRTRSLQFAILALPCVSLEAFGKLAQLGKRQGFDLAYALDRNVEGTRDVLVRKTFGWNFQKVNVGIRYASTTGITPSTVARMAAYVAASAVGSVRFHPFKPSYH